jgi:Tfp pilus assembly protein FimT
MVCIRRARVSGFSALELLIVIAIGLVIVALGLPSITKTQALYRVMGDARSLAEDLTLAKMRAGANFTQERLTLNTSSGSYVLELYNKSTSAWVSDGGPQYLTSGVSFGYGSITLPAGSQSTMAQTTPIIFNSRGIPVNASNQPTGEDAFYLTNSSGYYAVTVAMSGRIQIWKYVNSSWVAQ